MKKKIFLAFCFVVMLFNNENLRAAEKNTVDCVDTATQTICTTYYEVNNIVTDNIKAKTVYTWQYLGNVGKRKKVVTTNYKHNKAYSVQTLNYYDVKNVKDEALLSSEYKYYYNVVFDKKNKKYVSVYKNYIKQTYDKYGNMLTQSHRDNNKKLTKYTKTDFQKGNLKKKREYRFYVNGKISQSKKYVYNNGQLKSNRYGNATREIRKYKQKNNKSYLFYVQKGNYNQNGKLRITSSSYK